MSGHRDATTKVGRDTIRGFSRKQRKYKTDRERREAELKVIRASTRKRKRRRDERRKLPFWAR